MEGAVSKGWMLIVWRGEGAHAAAALGVWGWGKRAAGALTTLIGPLMLLARPLALLAGPLRLLAGALAVLAESSVLSGWAKSAGGSDGWKEENDVMVKVEMGDMESKALVSITSGFSAPRGTKGSP
jgi:hypothetical protein